MFKYKANNYTINGKSVPNGEKLKISFKCILKGIQCEALKSNGNRCTRRTIRALPYCWQHYKKINNVIIKKSKVLGDSGFGLFVCDPKKGKHEIVFFKNDLICQYNGDILNQTQLNARYGSGGQTAAYTWYNYETQEFLDSACKRYLGAYANDPKGTGKRANAAIKYKTITRKDRDRIDPFRYHRLPNKVPGLVAKRDIRNGEEIYVKYGKDWWKGIGGKFKVNLETKNTSKTNQKCK